MVKLKSKKCMENDFISNTSSIFYIIKISIKIQLKIRSENYLNLFYKFYYNFQ